MIEDHTPSEAVEPGAPADPAGSQTTTQVSDALARLQADLDDLMAGQGGRSAAQSLDNAVASLREVEQRNVTSVQLVALEDA